MKRIKVGNTYEPPEQDPGFRVRRKVLEVQETVLGTEYVKFLNLIEYRGIGVVSREAFEAWVAGHDMASSWEGGEDNG